MVSTCFFNESMGKPIELLQLNYCDNDVLSSALPSFFQTHVIEKYAIKIIIHSS